MEKGKTAASSYLPSPKQLLLFLILFLSPTQLGLHFWPSSALVYGIRVDYLAPTLYFLDLLIMIYLFVNKFTNLRINPLVVILLSNLIFSTNPLATLSWSLHLLLYSCFALSLTPIVLRRSGSLIKSSLLAAALFQLALATTQVSLGHSLQGPFYYLGERLVAVGSPSVAVGEFMGSVVLRAYGTFGHPNVLAGWLTVSLLIILKLTPSKKLITGNWLLVLSTVTTTIGIILAQSRAAALSFFGLIIPFQLLASLRRRLLYLVLLAALVFGHWAVVMPSRAELSFSERLDLQRLSLQVIQTYPLFGAGANASLTTYPTLAPNFRLLQPDHNSATLFLSWFGLIGVFAILYYFRRCFEFRISNFGFIIPIIPLLLLDHYFLTSPQGLFVFLLTLRLQFVKL